MNANPYFLSMQNREEVAEKLELTKKAEAWGKDGSDADGIGQIAGREEVDKISFWALVLRSLWLRCSLSPSLPSTP